MGHKDNVSPRDLPGFEPFKANERSLSTEMDWVLAMTIRMEGVCKQKAVRDGRSR